MVKFDQNLKLRKLKNTSQCKITRRMKFPNKIFLIDLRFSNKNKNLIFFLITIFNLFSNLTLDIFNKFRWILMILVQFDSSLFTNAYMIKKDIKNYV